MANQELAARVLHKLTHLEEGEVWDQGSWHDCVAGWTLRLSGRVFMSDDPTTRPDSGPRDYERLVTVDSDRDDKVWQDGGGRYTQPGWAAAELLGINRDGFVEGAYEGLWYDSKLDALEKLRLMAGDHV